MQYQWLIALVAVLIMAGGLGGIYYLIMQQKATFGNTTIQFLAIAFVLPLMIILGLFNVVRGDAIGTIIGVIVGYVLAGMSRARE